MNRRLAPSKSIPGRLKGARQARCDLLDDQRALCIDTAGVVRCTRRRHAALRDDAMFESDSRAQLQASRRLSRIRLYLVRK
jgi:hypothetical protein